MKDGQRKFGNKVYMTEQRKGTYTKNTLNI